MLAQANRLTKGSDYKAVVRRGLRVVGPHFVTYLRTSHEAIPGRFGFIVAKNVGGAVIRNRVRRRLKAASYELLSSVRPGTDIVIRALPASITFTWPAVTAELSNALSQGNARQGDARQVSAR